MLQKIKSAEIKIAVIGLGYVGLPLAVEFGKKFDVIGFDVKNSRLEALRRFEDVTLETSTEELKAAKKLRYSSNIDDLREIADYNTKLREKEFSEAEIIIDEEYNLLKESFKIMEVETILSNLRVSMEEIRQRETQIASSKMGDVDGSSKILNNLTNSIVNKIFFDISKNLKDAAKDDKQEILDSAEYIFNFD